MKPNSTQIALGLVVLLLICTVAFNRLGGRFLDPEHLGQKYCAGIFHPETGLGLACASTYAEVIEQAVVRLDVPKDCLRVALPENLHQGSLVVLGSIDGGCFLKDIARLPGEMRVVAGGKFNVNEDTKADLMTLPGIGESKANAIVQNRQEDGPFEDLYDLTRVYGIGDKTTARLDPWLEW